MNVHRITVLLPEGLIDWADRVASQTHTSRSQVICGALCEMQAREGARLAAEGYRYYAQESEAFAALSARAVAEALL
jgi:metal-responsive CopG/Arc/MetJ family transcriptional regulator